MIVVNEDQNLEYLMSISSSRTKESFGYNTL